MSHIFISYSREDQAYASRLADDIRKHGFDVWIDDRIDLGDRWFEEIEKAIIDCDAVVVIMSPASRASKWVQREILIADRDQKPLFPLLLEGREFGNLIDIQFADVRGGSLPQQDFYDRLAVVKQPAPQSGRWVLSRERRFPWMIAVAVLLVVVAGIIGYTLLDDDDDTATATTIPTDDPELALIPSETATFTPTPTILPPLVAAVEGVESNAGWTPHIDTIDGYQMALVPRGCFRMGSVSGDVDETPTARVCIDAPFWIDVTEVSNTQYGSFGRFNGADRPRDTVTWFEARDFCAERGGRLPSEAEWEYAARGPNGLTYPWGSEFDPALVVHADNSGGETVDVGTIPGGASWVGALDMSGNLWEWTGSIYQNYPYDPNDGREDTDPSDDAPPSLRGGSWTSDEFRLRATYRENSPPAYADEYFGFRCVVDVADQSPSETPAAQGTLPAAVVLEITQAGSQLSARAEPSAEADNVLDVLLWGDRVLWRGNTVAGEGREWLEVQLASGETAYLSNVDDYYVERDLTRSMAGLVVGATIRVTAEGDSMNLRADSSTSSRLITPLVEGDALTVIGGPVNAEYYLWWRLQLPDGRIGYAVEVPGWWRVE